MDKQKNFYENSFDILSLIASLHVMLAHTVGHILGGSSTVGQNLWRIIAPGPAVVALFVISGYLTMASYERSDNMKKYIIKRCVRIYPAMSVVVIVPLIIYMITGSVEINIDVAILNSIKKILLGRGLEIIPEGALGNGSLWTVFIQLQFYIITPFLHFLKKISNRIFQNMLILIALLFNICSHRIEIFLDGSLLGYIYSISCLPYLYMYMIGVVVYLNRNRAINIISNKKILFLEIIVYIIWHWGLGADYWTNWEYINPISGVLVSLIVLGTAYAAGQRNCKVDISYGIFLWHMPMIDVLRCIVGIRNSMLLFISVWFATIIIAFFSAVTVEKYAKRLANKILT